MVESMATTRSFIAPAFLAPLFTLAGIIATQLSLVDEKCHNVLFVEREMESICLKGFIAKCLGWGMTGAAAVVKVPQIRNMMKAKSSAGLSAASIYVELFMYCCSISYFLKQDLMFDNKINNFNEYGENVFLALQNIVIVFLMWKYTKASLFHKFAAFVVFMLFWFISFNLPQEAGPINECIDMMKLSFQQQQIPELFYSSSNPCLRVRLPQQILLTLTLPSMFMSRIPQIIQNFQNGHTGILSVITFSMNTVGGLARIFTTFQNPAGVDNTALLVYSISFLLNFTLMSQCILYRKATEKVLQEKKKEKTI